jgi:AcrR family transcriptional regulator
VSRTAAPRRPVDRRVDRSRRRLHEALVALILERGWDRVTVHAVCVRADVGRSTFYAHFADKEELLIGGLDHVRDDLRAHGGGATPFGFVHGLIEHVGASRRLVRAVIGKHSGLAVQRRFRAIVLELMDDELVARGVAAADRASAARFLGGALVELLIGWVDGASPRDGAEVVARFVALAAPVVASIARR